jgi:hypothetical protein
MDAELTGSLSMVVQDSAIVLLLQAHAPTRCKPSQLRLSPRPDRTHEKYVVSLEARSIRLETPQRCIHAE